MSPKEEAEAFVLLREWLQAMRPLRTVMESDSIDLVERTEKFLALPVGPESHGQRRG